MDLGHRKLLGQQCPFNHADPRGPRQPSPLPPPPPLPALPPPPPPRSIHGDLIINGMAVIASILSSALFLVIFCAFFKFHYNRRIRRSPLFFGTQDDFFNEDGGPSLYHFTRDINTMGLQQSVIESITVFYYKKDEGLIDGTECSVCLNEFQEDESLRLLPKCSHAFHLPCIDTWLRSHKSCPFCRAPVFCESMVGQTTGSEPSTIDSVSRNENLVENSQDHCVGSRGHDFGDGGSGTSGLRSCPIEDVKTSENSKKILVKSKTRTSGYVSGSELSSHLSEFQDDVQVTERSVASDSSSFSDSATHERRASLNTELPQMKYLKGKKSSNTCKLMKSSSMGRSLSKGPVSLKRSSSFGGKFSSSKQSRSLDSMVPS